MKENLQEQKLNKEGKQPCMWDMQMITLVDVYRLINLKPQHVILSRDARWMDIMWIAYM